MKEDILKKFIGLICFVVGLAACASQTQTGMVSRPEFLDSLKAMNDRYRVLLGQVDPTVIARIAALENTTTVIDGRITTLQGQLAPFKIVQGQFSGSAYRAALYVPGITADWIFPGAWLLNADTWTPDFEYLSPVWAKDSVWVTRADLPSNIPNAKFRLLGVGP